MWDVVYQCLREGSLDSAIETDTVQSNDFEALLDDCPGIEAIFFNGRKAEELFLKRVKPGLFEIPDLVRLPSTSPAHASLSRRGKVACWHQVRERLDAPPRGL